MDGLVAELISEGQPVYDNMFETALVLLKFSITHDQLFQKVMTEPVQKLYECSELIDQLRYDRQTSNRENKSLH